MKKGTIYLFGFFLILCGYSAQATHNRAGEIIYRHIAGSTYEVTIITYTKFSAPADRPSLAFDWGDGSPLDTLIRTSIDDITYKERDIRINRYVKTHTFPGPGEYLLSFEDPNRNNGILNLKPPESLGGRSDQVVFYIQSLLIINPFISPEQAHNNSVLLLNPPVDLGCLNQPYRHNPAAFDPDGDSLAFSIVPSRIQGGENAPFFLFPNEVSPGPNNNISINSRTGDLVWDSPRDSAGQYNIAILIEEYRNGFLIGAVLRDMQIDIGVCNNVAPDILPIPDTCITAGETLNLNVVAQDFDDDQVKLSAVGLPFFTNNPASFTQTKSQAPATGDFIWETSCMNVKRRDYDVIIKAEDDGGKVHLTPKIKVFKHGESIIRLTDFESFKIKVNGPPIENFSAVAQEDFVKLTWDKSICPNIIGYKIYRKSDSTGFVPGPCETGVPAHTGYNLLTTIFGHEDTLYNDQSALRGVEYCYLITTCFADGAESYASTEECTKLDLKSPVMTQVSVLETDSLFGKIQVKWFPPIKMDTNQFTAPYRYDVYRYINDGSPEKIYSSPSVNFLYQGKTTLLDSNINTVKNEYNYAINLYSNDSLITGSAFASSLFLNISPLDRINHLAWNETVPWNNRHYEIFRWNKVTTKYEKLAETSLRFYNDSNLTNDSTYCYYIQSSGEYLTKGIPKPIINLSQEVCATPVDFTPPCPPILQAEANCDEKATFINWIDTNSFCSYDALKYNLYFSAFEKGNFSLLESFSVGEVEYFYFGETSISGCFFMQVEDDNGNISDPTDTVCVDNCNAYTIPNVFTPDADGINDLFQPFSSAFVENVDVKIFNRWGKLVYETNDPEINWDGTYRNSSQKVSDGVYFYIILLDRITLKGIIQEEISGHVTVLRKLN